MKCTTKPTALFRNPIAAAILALLGAACPTQATVFTIDGGFENNALSGFSPPSGNGYQMVLDNQTLNLWGSENASIVTGTTDGVAPFGRRMLSVVRSGTTQTVQINNLTTLATPAEIAAIDLGLATYNLSAQFTAGAGVSGTRGQVIMSFYNFSGIDSSNLALNRIGFFNTALFLDSLADWELVSNSGTVPSGARYAISELVYLGVGDPGSTFVDDASFSIVPEPSSVALLGFGATATALFLLRRRKALSS